MPDSGVVLGAGAGDGVGAGAGAVELGAGDEVEGVEPPAGAAVSSFLLQAVRATARTEATIRVLLIMSRLLLKKCRGPVEGETRGP
ncbi:hypothetical protein CEG14_19435 [Bordetella genomosp. 1]|uniref:Uncharacterized protein n=1 Tax=Bordetella genomosp. 1 TaxID=1395607 RepID=A0A261S6N2_9BORD|nr:hypothetical protein CEG14_19435 [Bordetella genomosp. 1]